MFCRWMTAAAVLLLGVAVLSLGMALLEGQQSPGIYGQKVFCAAAAGENLTQRGPCMARFCTLFSGSSGNCTYIGGGRGGLLVDVGVSCRAAMNALAQVGAETSSLAGILITHEHIDHIRGLKVLLKKVKVPVYSAPETLEFLVRGDYLPPDAQLTPLTAPMEIGGMEVVPFETSHDGVAPQGYRITASDGRKIAVATDLGFVSDQVDRALSGCDLVLLESNYDPGMLSCGPYPYYLKKRIMSPKGHLSNEDCAAQLVRLVETGTTRVVLAHLSQENNLPQLAFETAKSELAASGCRLGEVYLLQVASLKEPDPMIVF